jgi:CBS domain-containing protein
MKTIQEVMESRPIAVKPDTLLHDALGLLTENRISGLPVTNADGKVVGILTEKDVLKLFWENHARVVDDVMTRDPVMISVDAPLVDVVDCLMANDFRRVLIHDHDQLVGLVSRADLMPSLIEILRERL